MKQLLLFLFVLCTAQSYAQNSVNIFQKSGRVICYTFSDRPKVEFEGERFFISVSQKTIEIPMSNIAKFTFSDEDYATGIENVKTNDFQSDYVEIYTIGGKLVKKDRLTDNTKLTSIDDLANGTYIIKNGSTTYKITKK